MNPIKFHPKRDIFLIAMLLTMPVLAYAQTLSENCQALIQLKNDLWLTKQDGAPLVRLTTDGRHKDSAAVSSDGKVIAYVSESLGENVRLIDVSGKFLADINVHEGEQLNGDAKAYLSQVKWPYPNLLAAIGDIVPSKGYLRYYFIKISTGSITPALLQHIPPTDSDGRCAPSPNSKLVACTFEVGGMDINDRRVFNTTDPLLSNTHLQTLDVAIGSTVTTSTVPPFKLEVLETPEKADVHEGAVLLRIITPDPNGDMEPQYLSPGEMWPVSYLVESADVPTIYGFTLAVSRGKHKHDKDDVVTIDVVKSVTGEFKLEGDPAWDMHGRRIATVEVNDLGQRFLIIINRQKSDENNDGKDDKRDEEHRFDGINPKDFLPLDVREPLPIDGPIKSIEFTSDTHIRVVGATKVFDQDIPAFGEVPANTNYIVTDALPGQIPDRSSSDSTSTTVVQGWVCK